MASGLESFLNQTVSIITADGRNFIGTLKGFDQTVNLIVDESHERVWGQQGGGAHQVILGLHLIRGDNVALIGQLDEARDSALHSSHAHITADPLPPILH